MSSFDQNPNQMLLAGFRTNNPEPKWNGLTPLPKERSGHAAVSLDENCIVAVGGWDGDGRDDLKSVSVCNKSTNEWTSNGWPGF